MFNLVKNFFGFGEKPSDAVVVAPYKIDVPLMDTKPQEIVVPEAVAPAQKPAKRAPAKPKAVAAPTAKPPAKPKKPKAVVK